MKKNILLIINLLIILLPFIFYTLSVETTSVAMVVSKWSENSEGLNDFISNVSVYLDSIIYVNALFYIVFQIVNYSFYIFKKKKALIFASVIELFVVISYLSVVQNINTNVFIIFIPLINSLIYLYILQMNLE